jgi:hypothetical protein
MNQARAAPSAMKPRMNRTAAGFFMVARWREIRTARGRSWGRGCGWVAAWGLGAEGGSETPPYFWGFT